MCEASIGVEKKRIGLKHLVESSIFTPPWSVPGRNTMSDISTVCTMTRFMGHFGEKHAQKLHRKTMQRFQMKIGNMCLI